jgi:hypothetical protein
LLRDRFSVWQLAANEGARLQLPTTAKNRLLTAAQSAPLASKMDHLPLV